MSSETSGKKETQNKQVDPESELDAETLDKIKHPPSIDNAMRELSPEELLGNQAMAPQMIDDRGDSRDDLKRD